MRSVEALGNDRARAHPAEMKARVPKHGNPTGYVVVETDATVGARIGRDLFNADGTLFDPATLAPAASAADPATPAPGTYTDAMADERVAAAIAALPDFAAADTTYENASSGLAATNVQDAIDELAAAPASGGGDMEKLAEVVVTTAQTDIDFSSLDLSADRFYVIKAFVVPGASGSHLVNLFYNGDTTDANYNSQFLYGLNGTAGASNATTATICFNNAMPDTSNPYSFDVNLSQFTGTKPCAESRCVGLHTTGAPFPHAYAQRRNNTANVTSIKLRNSITNGFGVGTLVRLYRLN